MCLACASTATPAVHCRQSPSDLVYLACNTAGLIVLNVAQWSRNQDVSCNTGNRRTSFTLGGPAFGRVSGTCPRSGCSWLIHRLRPE